MPTNPLTASTGRFIIRSDSPDQLATFIKDVDVDPDMKLVDSIGPVDHPHTVVVAMSDEKASALERRFRSTKNQLKIEPDRPLSMFGNSFGG